jgi:ATP-dependent Clp protease ATP-binding subunit ClpA
LDRASLTLGDNRKVDFQKAMIFMTSNVGARQLDNMLRPGFGFVRDGAVSHEQLKASGLGAARKKFPPEFCNRLSGQVVFAPLSADTLRRIVDLQLSRVQDRIHKSGNPFVLSCTDKVKDELLEEGTDPRYGARELKRVIERRLVVPLAKQVCAGAIHSGDYVRVKHGYHFDVQHAAAVA